jgi:hypothetical protein
MRAVVILRMRGPGPWILGLLWDMIFQWPCHPCRGSRGSVSPHGGERKRARALSRGRGVRAPPLSLPKGQQENAALVRATPAAQRECAADVEIWAVQQLVTIPGWLHSIKMQDWIKRNSLLYINKRPRSLKIKKKWAEEEQFTVRKGGTRWQPKPYPPHPSGDLGARSHGFRENSRYRVGNGILFQKISAV